MWTRGWWVKTGRPSIAVDAECQPHIVYTTLWPYYRLNYLTRSGNGWQRQTIDGGGTSTGYVGTFPRILIDAAGVVHVIYADGLHGQLETCQTGCGPMADRGHRHDRHPGDVYRMQAGALAGAMDSTGGIGVVYWDGDDGMLKYAYLAEPESDVDPIPGGQWQSE